MKIVLVLGAIILCTPVLLFAQSSVVPWTKDQPCCTYDLENGIWTTKYSDKNIQIEVMSPRFGVARGDFEVFWVFVKNNGLPRFELKLSDFVLKLTIPKAKIIPAIDPDDLAGWQTDQSDSRYNAERRAAQNETTTGTVTDNKGNVATVVVKQPNQDAVKEIDREQAQVEQSREKVAGDVRKNSLRMNTIRPGQEVNGSLWFRKTKKATGGFLEVTVNGTVYRIPLQDELK